MRTKVLPTLCVLLLVLSGPIPDIVIGTQENNHPYFLGKFADKQVLPGCDMDIYISIYSDFQKSVWRGWLGGVQRSVLAPRAISSPRPRPEI